MHSCARPTEGAKARDTALGRLTIPEGHGVVPLIRHANHDPSVFGEPDRYNLDRDANLHVGFGYGPHLRQGRPLARTVQATTSWTLLGTILTLFKSWLAHRDASRLPIGGA